MDSLTYELIDTTDLPIDANPNAGGGLRIFPNDKVPDDPVDRRKIRVKARLNRVAAGGRIYFRNFDVDDPSADTAPIDTNDTASVKTGNDNNGNVDGTQATRGGLLSVPVSNPPNPFDCQPFTNAGVSGMSCLTDTSGVATVDFTVTMQPGDNFTVVASPDLDYISSLVPTADGINLKDTNNIQTPVTRTDDNACLTSTSKACRADMLTVWRRLHLEVDSMGDVGADNKVEGTITQTGFAPGNCANPGPTPTPTPTPGPGPAPTPCTPAATGFVVTPDPGQQIDDGRFQNGRIVVGQRYYFVRDNTPTNIILRGVDGVASKTSAGKRFTLYDDDDYNADDGLVDGDFNEPVVQLLDSFKYLSTEDGNYPDGKPKNLYAAAYIKPEYNWAGVVRQYDQNNLQFELNVEDGNNNATVINVVNRNRDSKNDERNEFWIGYIVIGYQGPQFKDFDGIDPTGQFNEDARTGVAPGEFMNGVEVSRCDCYMSGNCPQGGTLCTLPNGAPALPRGAFGCVIFEEVIQDLKKYFLFPPPPVSARTIEETKLTIAHELGHQFGVLGDQKRATFKLMDYSDYVGNVVNDESFHPEHLNLMRRRIKSPGQ